MRELKRYISPLISLALMGTLFVITLAIFVGSSLGWFTENKQTTASGISLSTIGVAQTEQYFILDGVRVEEDAGDFLSGMMPGQTKTVQLYFRNKSSYAIALNLAVEKPDFENDTPLIIDGLYHYFGSQIRFKSIRNGENEHLALSDEDAYLLTLDSSLYKNGLAPTSIEEAYDFSSAQRKMLLTEPIEVRAGGEIVLDITIEFVDNGELQNAYMYFGNTSSEENADEQKAALVVSREILCIIDPI